MLGRKVRLVKVMLYVFNTHHKHCMQMKLSENLGQDWDKIGTGNHKTYDIMLLSKTIICARIYQKRQCEKAVGISR